MDELSISSIAVNLKSLNPLTAKGTKFLRKARKDDIFNNLSLRTLCNP